MKIEFDSCRQLAGLLHNGLQFAAPEKEGRPILAALSLETSGDTLQVVATNSYVLAIQRATMSADFGDSSKLLLKGETAKEILKTIKVEKLGKWGVSLEIGDDGAAHLSYGIHNATFASAVQEGDYPNWRGLLKHRPDLSDGKRGRGVTLNSEYVAGITGAIWPTDGEKRKDFTPMVRFGDPVDNLKPVPFTVRNLRHAVVVAGVIMPVRDGSETVSEDTYNHLAEYAKPLDQ